MLHITFNENSVNLLTSLIGKRFNVYKYAPIGSGTYGNILLVIDSTPYELQNRQRVVVMNGEPTDLAMFSFMQLANEFTPDCGDRLVSTVVDAVIQDVFVVQDRVVLVEGERIAMDMALVFKTENGVTAFSRDAQFSEFITISDTVDLDTVYPICRAKDSWRNDDAAEVDIQRSFVS